MGGGRGGGPRNPGDGPCPFWRDLSRSKGYSTHTPCVTRSLLTFMLFGKLGGDRDGLELVIGVVVVGDIVEYRYVDTS